MKSILIVLLGIVEPGSVANHSQKVDTKAPVKNTKTFEGVFGRHHPVTYIIKSSEEVSLERLQLALKVPVFKFKHEKMAKGFLYTFDLESDPSEEFWNSVMKSNPWILKVEKQGYSKKLKAKIIRKPHLTERKSPKEPK